MKTYAIILFVLFCNGKVYAEFNSPSHFSVNMSAKVAKYKAAIWSHAYKDGSPIISGQSHSGNCGEIKILADKGQDIFILGDIINIARCKKRY